MSNTRHTECYDLSLTHRGVVGTYTDGVYTHPLCDLHAEQCGFKTPETHDELLTRLGF